MFDKTKYLIRQKEMEGKQSRKIICYSRQGCEVRTTHVVLAVLLVECVELNRRPAAGERQGC